MTEKPDTHDEQPEDAKPSGYYLTASDDEVLAECRRLNIKPPLSLRYRTAK